jgi:hypothetical protein
MAFARAVSLFALERKTPEPLGFALVRYFFLVCAFGILFVGM